MKTQTLSIKQMQTLKDRGVDTSKASYFIPDSCKSFAEKYDYKGNQSIIVIPEKSFTVADLMGMLPKGVGAVGDAWFHRLDMLPLRDNEWCISYISNNRCIFCSHNAPLIDSLYETIIWLLDNGYELNE